MKYVHISNCIKYYLAINYIPLAFILAYRDLVLCQDLVQHKMRNFNYCQLTNSDSLATLAL